MLWGHHSTGHIDTFNCQVNSKISRWAGKNHQGVDVGSVTDRLTLSQRPISSPQHIIRDSTINLFRTRARAALKGMATIRQ